MMILLRQALAHELSQLPYEMSSWKFLKEANCWGLTGGTYDSPGDEMAASAITVPCAIDCAGWEGGRLVKAEYNVYFSGSAESHPGHHKDSEDCSLSDMRPKG